jgi:hypothetical protein
MARSRRVSARWPRIWPRMSFINWKGYRPNDPNAQRIGHRIAQSLSGGTDPPGSDALCPGTDGIPYIWTFDSGRPGRHVAITAIVHGNEPCGALALDWLLRHEARPVAGKLSLAFMNVAAHEAFDRDVPDASRWIDEDFNRLWSPDVLDDPDRKLTEELRRAREVRPWLDTVDMLLDIHSMQSKASALTIAGLLPKGRDLARDVGYPRWSSTTTAMPKGCGCATMAGSVTLRHRAMPCWSNVASIGKPPPKASRWKPRSGFCGRRAVLMAISHRTGWQAAPARADAVLSGLARSDDRDRRSVSPRTGAGWNTCPRHPDRT